MEATLTNIANARAEWFIRTMRLNAEDSAEVREDFRFCAWLWAGEYRDGKCSREQAMNVITTLQPVL